jgi:serine/threonine protein kinase
MEAAERCEFGSGEIIDGRYVVHHKLGEGTFGIVYQVSDGSGQYYALKILKLWVIPPLIRKKHIERFEVEIETSHILSPYLVRSFRHGKVSGNPYFVMEYCPNGTLKDRIGRTEVSALSQTAREMLWGLGELHRHGKVHRDMKPDNVLFKADDTAALSDFGIAGDRYKRMTERSFLRGRNRDVFGTYAYMPPEQFRAEHEATVLPTTDIFSYGVTLYEVMTGQLPFGVIGDHNELVMYQERCKKGAWDRSTFLRASAFSGYFPLLESCLQPDFRKRPQTVEDTLALLPPLTPDVSESVFLTVLQGEEYGKTWRLNDYGTRIITLGRYDGGNTRNAISIKETRSSYISRRHCTLERDLLDGNWYIRDGQWDASYGWIRSHNGTSVNGALVDGRGSPLRAGDVITIGNTILTVNG